MRRETVLILLFPFGPLIRRLRASFAFRASNDARRESRRAIPARSLSLSLSLVHACAVVAARKDTRTCARIRARWWRRLVKVETLRAALRNEIATLSPSDTGSTLKARSQEGIETFSVTGRSRHTSLPRTRAIKEVIRVREEDLRTWLWWNKLISRCFIEIFYRIFP